MNASLWAPALTSIRRRARAAPTAADVVVIGAGYTGLNAARELARSGQHVVVLDKDAAGHGASGVNFGSAALGVAASFASIRRRYGQASARTVAELSARALATLCAVINDEGIECDLQRSGHITVALTARHVAALEGTKRGWDQLADHELTLLSGDELREYLDIDGLRGGLLNANSYSLDPAKYLAGLFNAASDAGATIVEQTAVTGIQSLGTKYFECRWPGGRIRSKHVVVCTNGVPFRAFPLSYRGLVPINSYLIATEPLDGARSTRISPHVFATAHAIPNYFRRTAENRLLFGSRKDIAAQPCQPRDSRELTSRMNTLLPFTSGVAVTHAWSGALGFTFDLLPHVGAADGVFYALGCCGKGIPWSAYCGIAAARMVMGEQTSARVLARPMVQPAYYRGRAWFLQPLSWYLRLKDFWN